LYGLWKYKQTAKRKIIKYNWYKDSAENEKHTNTFFETLFQDLSAKYDEIHLYSVFKELKIQPKHPRILTVQYSGESYAANPALFDINFIPGHSDTSNIIPIPYFTLPLYKLQVTGVDIQTFTRHRTFTKPKTKFCLFAVSNPHHKERIEFFKQLTQHKHVDSCGKVENNTGSRCPGDHGAGEFCDYISDYKFMICFENNSTKHYLTEKLLNAYNCGTIPIYWGCPNVFDYINPSAILYLKPQYTEADVEALIQTILQLDADDTLYRRKYESVFFKDGRVPDLMNMDTLRESVNRIALA